MKLLTVDTVEDAREKAMQALAEQEMKTESRDLLSAVGFCLARDIYAKEPVPSFVRSTVDGYAVRAADTGGASESLPAFLNVVGEVQMGEESSVEIRPGTCAYVPTGGMVPEGADAVVMVEYCEHFLEDQVAVYQTAPCGANVVHIGEDMKEGALVLLKGTVLRPQEIGALAALGLTEVCVYVPWKLTVISTGDELVSPKEQPGKGQIRDINTYGICAQAKKMNLTVEDCFVLKDDRKLLEDTIKKAMVKSDIVVISGGSSQGKKDVTNSVIDEIASEGAFTHGLALKPGKPTILGYDRPSETLLLGLPGHPAAAMIVFELTAGWLWRARTGQKEPYTFPAVMAVNLAAAPGKKTCQLVKITEDNKGCKVAVPVLGRSGMITVLTRADGYVEVEVNQEGLKKGDTVEVHPF